MPETQEFRLGDLLSVTLHLPTGDPRSLVGFMTQNRPFPIFLFPSVLGQCAQSLVQQHPWLGGIRLPRWLIERGGDWAAFWCWLDTQEIKHGNEHQVQPLEKLVMPDMRFEYDGRLVTYDELPDEEKQILREMGIEGLGGDDPAR